MQCTKPIILHLHTPEELTVPCGKCLACRIKKRSEWTLRLTHELEDYKNDSSFVTLTYSDDNLPDAGSLVKKHVQDFLKRLRRSLSERRIRYYISGEYGDNTGRPHYHAILFGVSLHPSDKRAVMRCWDKCDWSIPAIRQRSFGSVTPDSIQYVAGYVTKKMEDDYYAERFKQPIFRISSIGIGRNYCDNNRNMLVNNLCIKSRGTELSLPRYYVKRLGIDSELLKQKGIERDIEIVSKITGYELTSDELYMQAPSDVVVKHITSVRRLKAQHDLNLKAKLSLKKQIF